MDPTLTLRPARKIKPPEEAVLQVGEFDSHGTTRASYKERSIEVEHGIPGEEVRALVYGRRRRWAKIEEILRTSPDRVVAPCDAFHQGCGGCQWQMLRYDSQVSRKRLRAEQAFADNGISIELADVRTDADVWRYRVTAGISLGRGAGFRRRGTQSIVPLSDCPISHPLVGELAAHLNHLLEAQALPNYFGEVGIEVRVVEAEGGGDALHCCIVPSPASRYASIDAILELAKAVTQLSWVEGVLYRHRQDLPQLLFGRPFGWTTLRGRPFALSAATFFQTNLRLFPQLLDRCLESAQTTGTETVVDVYGGVGVFGLSMAPMVRRVVEIELDPVGIEAAQLTRERQELHNVELVAGTAESLMAKLAGVDIVVVDPPRSGLTPKVVTAIQDLRPRRILYASCLATSMARDVRQFLDTGYRLGPVTGYDFYPQTYHLELFGTLELSRKRPYAVDKPVDDKV